MCRMKLKVQVVAFLALVILCMPAVTAQAQGHKTWPVETELITPDGNLDAPDEWKRVGIVTFTNSNSNYLIEVFPDEPYRISDIAIHVVEASNAEEFEAELVGLLDKKTGKPNAGKFDYKKDFLDEDGIPSDYHYQLVSLDNFEECWGQNLENCPGLYTIVVASLVDGEGVKLPESAYAEESGTFDRLDKLGERVWPGYVTYQRARAMAGHFVDANVNGLLYETFSQYGYTTDSGVTGVDGQFWFLPEEQIKFWAGDLYLGETLADRRIAPPDLFGVVGMDDDRVINMAWLLQSLDADGNPGQGAINITGPVVSCLNTTLAARYGTSLPTPGTLFSDDFEVGQLIVEIITTCGDDDVELATITRDEAYDNLNFGMQAGNIMKRNISKTPGMASDKAKIEIMPVYVPTQRPDGTPTLIEYFDAEGNVIETRDKAKPIVVTYLDEVEGTGALDVFVAISRDDGDSWKRRNISKTASKSSFLLDELYEIGYPGESWKPMMKVKDNKIFVAWTDKYCRGGRPGYAITTCDGLDVDSDNDGAPDTCEICRETDEGTKCMFDYPGDDTYWQDDIFGVAGPQKSVIYEDFPSIGEVPYSCVWTARAVIESDGDIQWFKPERVSSGRRDAYQLFAGAGTGVGFAIVWQEDPKGLRPGEGEGPGEGWSGARANNKTDIWYSYITLDDFGLVDENYPSGNVGYGEDIVDTDPDLAGRVKALVPMSLPVRISDNEMCSLENMDPDGGQGDHDYDGEGQGTHRYCGSYETASVATKESPGPDPLCAYTVEKANPKGEIHHVCVTADGRFLDGNTGASRANVFLQPYKKSDGSKSAWAIIGYEESKGVGIPPDNEEHDCDSDSEDEHDAKYKPDEGKNVIYHSFDFMNPELVGGGGILNLPETDANGDPVYVVDEDGFLLLDWKGEPQLAYENARRVRFVSQPKSKKGLSGTVLVALWRQGEEGKGKPADIFMRRLKASPSGNPYAYANFVPGAQNVSSVEPDPNYLWQDPFDPDKPVKMLRWTWSPANLADSSAQNPRIDAKAHRGALNGDDLLIGYSWTPNWGRAANDKYDFYVRRSFNGGKTWTTDPGDSEIKHNVVWRVPVVDYDTQTVTWDEEVETTAYGPGASEPPRNVSNLRNNRMSVLEPRLVKTPGTIKNPNGSSTGNPEDIWDSSVYQLAWGVERNQNDMADGSPKMPLDIYYGRTQDKGQRYESVVITPQGGNGKPQEGWNPLANDKPEQGAAQLRQTPDGSRMYGIWLEESDGGSDIMFRRVDYREVD